MAGRDGRRVIVAAMYWDKRGQATPESDEGIDRPLLSLACSPDSMAIVECVFKYMNIQSTCSVCGHFLIGQIESRLGNGARGAVRVMGVSPRAVGDDRLPGSVGLGNLARGHSNFISNSY